MEEKWSSLPKDALDMIVKLLHPNQLDILRVRAVCSWWRSSIPPSKSSPFQLISFHSNLSPFILKQKTTLVVSPSYANAKIIDEADPVPWIIQVIETGPNKLSILNPFSYESNYSYFPNHANLPNHINLLDYKIIEINRSYDLSQFVPSNDLGHPIVFKKAIVVTDNDNSTLIYSRGEECCYNSKVFFVYNDGDLAFWESGMKEWVRIGYIDGVLEMIRYKGQLYVVDYYGRFVVIDMVTCNVQHCGECPRLSMLDLYQVYCMAEFNGHLYMVAYHKFYCCLSVYVLDEDEEEDALAWKHSSDLGGGIFCVFNHTLMCAISPKDLGGHYANTVYIDGFWHYYGPKLRDMEVCLCEPSHKS